MTNQNNQSQSISQAKSGTVKTAKKQMALSFLNAGGAKLMPQSLLTKRTMRLKMEIKSKLYHAYQTEVERLGQKESCRILRVPQSVISRALNHPEMVSMGWFVKSLRRFGYKCVFTVTIDKAL